MQWMASSTRHEKKRGEVAPSQENGVHENLPIHATDVKIGRQGLWSSYYKYV